MWPNRDLRPWPWHGVEVLLVIMATTVWSCLRVHGARFCLHPHHIWGTLLLFLKYINASISYDFLNQKWEIMFVIFPYWLTSCSHTWVKSDTTITRWADILRHWRRWKYRDLFWWRHFIQLDDPWFVQYRISISPKIFRGVGYLMKYPIPLRFYQVRWISCQVNIHAPWYPSPLWHIHFSGEILVWKSDKLTLSTNTMDMHLW